MSFRVFAAICTLLSTAILLELQGVTICRFTLVSPSFAETPTNAIDDAQVTLSDLDQIILKAKNLDGFLTNTEIQNEYFHALQSYFGEDRFPRLAFDGILQQLKHLRREVPEVAERLWQTDHLGEGFSIKTSVKTSGRSLNQIEWNRYFQDLQIKLLKTMDSSKLLRESKPLWTYFSRACAQ